MTYKDKKLYYNLEILYNKYSPFIISALLVIYHILCFLFPWDLTLIEYICLPSVFTSLHMYNSRQTFMLCKVHRCFVNYVIGNTIACAANQYWVDPYMNIYWFAFVMAGSMLAMLLGLIYYTQEHAKINIKHAQKNS